MEYYIQGNAANADQIKAAFEKLGFIKEDHRDIYENNVLFFTVNGDKNVHYCWIDQPYCNIIKTHPDYQELELLIEPNFKAGDWLVYKDGGTFCGGLKTAQVQIVEKDKYIFTHGTNSNHRLIDNECRLWSIADAKDGDVLVSRSDNPFIYNGNIEFLSAGAYIGISQDGKIMLDMFPSRTWTNIKDIRPATNEQRVLLFKKIQEAGYQWYAGKKEIRKIKPHYDIANFYAGMPVLVRDFPEENWQYVHFSNYVHYDGGVIKFWACGVPWRQCIPFNNDTKHLLGTTNPCGEEYINW